MKNKFSKKIAKEIARKSFAYTIDCVLGNGDSPEYTLRDEGSSFEQNFEEDLQERGITPTTYKIQIVNKCYDKMTGDCKKHIEKFFKRL